MPESDRGFGYGGSGGFDWIWIVVIIIIAILLIPGLFGGTGAKDNCYKG